MTQEKKKKSPLSLPILALPNEEACSRSRPGCGWAPDTVETPSGFTTFSIILLSSATSLPFFPQGKICKRNEHVDFQQQVKSAVTSAEGCPVKSQQTGVLQASEGVTMAKPAECHTGLS